MKQTNRWAVCALLFGATLLNYLDRQTLAVTAPLVRAEMGLDLAQLGILFSAFYWSYAAGQLLVGLVIDRVGVRWAYAAAVGAWSLAGAAAALATGFWSLLALRVLLGLCESANWPSALRVVSRVFAPSERALANGIFQSGTSIGALVAPPLLMGLAAATGWRTGFAAVGALGLVWVSLWLWRFRGLSPQRGEGQGEGPGLATILRSRRFWGLALASAFLNPCLYFYVNWLPTFFVESGERLGARLAGVLVVIYLALDVGYLSGGAGVAWLARRMEVVRARRLVLGAGVPLMATVALVPQAGPSMGAALTAVAALGLGWFMVNYLAFAAEVSHGRVATVAGWLGAAGSIAGALFMALVGSVSKARGFAVPFLLVGLMPMVALAGIWVSTATGLGARARHVVAVEEGA